MPSATEAVVTGPTDLDVKVHKEKRLAEMDPSKLTITRTTKPTTLPKDLEFKWGAHFTDHMLTIEFIPELGWQAPEIKPYGPLSLDPASACLQYAPSLFEGMKAYKRQGGRAVLFRPEMNMARMRRSAERVALPDFDPEALIELIKALVKVDEHLIPPPPCSLYMRPTLIGTRNTLGVAPSTACLLYVILSPVGPFFPQKKANPAVDAALSASNGNGNGHGHGGSAPSPTDSGTTTPVSFSNGTRTPPATLVSAETTYPSTMTLQPVSLLATTSATRSWPGGVGSYKLAGNYSPCFKPQMLALQKGYQQNLWCIDESAFEPRASGGAVLQECGQMNLFVAFKGRDTRGADGEGEVEIELVTPGLDTETILPGVTRDSVLTLARQHAAGEISLPFMPASYKLKVSERRILLSELVDRSRAGEVLEVYGSGTAAVICPIGRIGLEDGSPDLEIPKYEGGLGPVARSIFEQINAIQEGSLVHPWSVPCSG